MKSFFLYRRVEIPVVSSLNKRGFRGHPGNHSLVGLTPSSGKMVELIVKKIIGHVDINTACGKQSAQLF